MFLRTFIMSYIVYKYCRNEVICDYQLHDLFKLSEIITINNFLAALTLSRV